MSITQVVSTVQGETGPLLLYTAPESFVKDEFTPESEAYALAMILYELLTGTPTSTTRLSIQD